jgi:hypothetical protein
MPTDTGRARSLLTTVMSTIESPANTPSNQPAVMAAVECKLALHFNCAENTDILYSHDG